MDKEELLNELMKLNVRCHDELINYVEFCLKNNQNSKISNVTAHHHILPKAKTLPFIEYADLSVNSWNGVHLKKYDHYYAHWLLLKAVDESAIAYAFFKMHKTGVSKNNLLSEELLSEDLFYELYRNSYTPWNKGTTGLVIAWNKGLPAELQPFYGKTMTGDHKAKIGKANSGDNNYWRNNKMSDEHKRKNSEANKAIIKTDEWNRKNSEKRTGTKLMSNNCQTKYIQPEDINNKLLEGWVFGRIKNTLEE